MKEGDSHRIALILRQIVERRRVHLAEAGGRGFESMPPGAVPRPALARDEQPFLRALAERSPHAIIAEVKLGSPRLGSIVDRIDPEDQARQYADHGAAALSVVVEPEFFFGSYEVLERTRVASGLPAIAKDFIVDPLQLDWARDAGADAVLLIAALYDERRLADLADQARRRGLVPLIETHDRSDLAKLGQPNSSSSPSSPSSPSCPSWELVGINNRDLRTFEVDLRHSIELVPDLPTSALRVAESGLRGPDELARLRSAGFDAFLIGESLLLADDPGAKLRELLG